MNSHARVNLLLNALQDTLRVPLLFFHTACGTGHSFADRVQGVLLIKSIV
ncbi:hypothetical protein RR11_926 [Ruegeria sp. R11]|nr:hypothetical protein RR11_926 [Ruegeria sp. R11]